MKKLYTLALVAATVSVSASAQFEAFKARDLLAPLAKVSQATAEKAVFDTTVGSAILPNEAQAVSTVDDLCKEYTWTYYNGLADNPGWQTASMTISKESDTKVKLVGFYSTFPVTADVDLEKGTLSISKQFMFTNTLYNEDVYFWRKYWNSDGQGSNDSEDPLVGTIDKATGAIEFDDYDIATVGISGRGYYLFGYYNEFAPVDKSNELTFDIEDCADDNKFTAEFTLGDNIEKFKILNMPGHYTGSSQLYSLVAQYSPNTFTKTQKTITVDGSTMTRGAYTMIVAALNAGGEVVGGDTQLFFINQDEEDQWEDVAGKATYSEDFIASIYTSAGVKEHLVTIQRNKETAGFYRLVNPYDAPYAYASQSEHAGEHNHYIYIHAEDPEKVYLEESALGFDLGDGTAFGGSLVGNAMDVDGDDFDPEEYAAYYGKLEGNTVTFPVNSLLTGEARYNKGTMYYANTNGGFKVVLPETDGVDNVAVETSANAPVQYFNMQGQRIDNPAAGQLVIKRQGSQVVKVQVK